MSTTNIALLHLWILASQASYMYLSNKAQLKKHRYLYLIAIPIITAYPVIISSQDMHAYNLYEYAIVFFIAFAAIVDSSIAALFNREYLTDTEGMSLTLSFFLICTVTAFCGDVSMIVRMVTVFLLVGAFLVFIIMKKRSLIELLKGIPLAALSIVCSWLFVHFVLKI